MPHAHFHFTCSWHGIVPKDYPELDPNLFPLPLTEHLPNAVHEAFRLWDDLPDVACQLIKPALVLTFNPGDLERSLAAMFASPAPIAPEIWQVTAIRFLDGPTSPEVSFTADFLLNLSVFVPTSLELAQLEKSTNAQLADGLSLSLRAKSLFPLFTSEAIGATITV